MLPDTVHFILMLLLCGTLVRIAEYLLAANASDNRFYKFLVFAY